MDKTANVLTNAQLDAYEEDGYIVLKQFFDRETIDELTAAMVELLSATKRGTPGVGFDPWTTQPGDALNPNRVYWYNDIFLQHPRLDAHMRDRRLVSVFEDIYKCSVFAFQSAAVIKTPRFNFDFQGWHQDAPDYIPLTNFKLASALTYLGDMGPDTGGTSVIPGSHRKPLLNRRYVKVVGWPVRKRILVDLEPFASNSKTPQFRPGDVLIFHPCLMHRANSNYTDKTKIGLINAYRAADCFDLTSRNSFKADNILVSKP